MAIADILPTDVAEDDFEGAGVDTVTVHTWTREDYERMAELGFFQDRRVELVDGVVYEFMTPQLSPHATGVRKASKAMEAVFSRGYTSVLNSPSPSVPNRCLSPMSPSSSESRTTISMPILPRPS